MAGFSWAATGSQESSPELEIPLPSLNSEFGLTQDFLVLLEGLGMVSYPLGSPGARAQPSEAGGFGPTPDRTGPGKVLHGSSVLTNVIGRMTGPGWGGPVSFRGRGSTGATTQEFMQSMLAAMGKASVICQASMKEEMRSQEGTSCWCEVPAKG